MTLEEAKSILVWAALGATYEELPAHLYNEAVRHLESHSLTKPLRTHMFAKFRAECAQWHLENVRTFEGMVDREIANELQRSQESATSDLFG